MSNNILHISTSVRADESATRMLAGELIARLSNSETQVVNRDLVESVPLLSVAAAADLTTPVAERSPAAVADLALADQFISELKGAEVIVIDAPIYNFGVPANLKAWADLVARAGTTFSYGESGPVGMVADRPVYIVSASGGTEIGGEMDFGTTWLRHFLGFLGLTNVTVIAANQLAVDAEAGLAGARHQIAAA